MHPPSQSLRRGRARIDANTEERPTAAPKFSGVKLTQIDADESAREAKPSKSAKRYLRLSSSLCAFASLRELLSSSSFASLPSAKNPSPSLASSIPRPRDYNYFTPEMLRGKRFAALPGFAFLRGGDHLRKSAFISPRRISGLRFCLSFLCVLCVLLRLGKVV